MKGYGAVTPPQGLAALQLLLGQGTKPLTPAAVTINPFNWKSFLSGLALFPLEITYGPFVTT